MPLYIVQCGLDDPALNTPEIDSALESLDVCVRPFPGTWLVEAALSAYQIETLLEKHLKPGDRLLILRLGQEGTWRGVSGDAHIFMEDNFKRNRYGSAPP